MFSPSGLGRAFGAVFARPMVKFIATRAAPRAQNQSWQEYWRHLADLTKEELEQARRDVLEQHARREALKEFNQREKSELERRRREEFERMKKTELERLERQRREQSERRGRESDLGGQQSEPSGIRVSSVGRILHLRDSGEELKSFFGKPNYYILIPNSADKVPGPLLKDFAEKVPNLIKGYTEHPNDLVVGAKSKVIVFPNRLHAQDALDPDYIAQRIKDLGRIGREGAIDPSSTLVIPKREFGITNLHEQPKIRDAIIEHLSGHDIVLVDQAMRGN
jgi:hypothetical protein